MKSDAFYFAPDQFNPGGFELAFKNPKCPFGRCIMHVVQGEPKAPFHGWDGNTEAPTITPSIDCQKPIRCGWHGHINKGEVTP